MNSRLVLQLFDSSDIDYIKEVLGYVVEEFLIGPEGLEVLHKYGINELYELTYTMEYEYKVISGNTYRELASYLYDLAYEDECIGLLRYFRGLLSKVRNSKDIEKIMRDFTKELITIVDFKSYDGDYNIVNFIKFLLNHYTS